MRICAFVKDFLIYSPLFHFTVTIFFEKKKEIIFIIEDEYGIVEKVEKINVSSNEPKEFEVLF